MKTQMLCAIALGVAAIGGAAAAQDSDSVNVTSTVTARCAALNDASAPLALGELVQSGTGEVVSVFAGTTTSYSVPGYWCNAPANLTLAATPLQNVDVVDDGGDPSFTTRVDYTASLVWDDVNRTKNTAVAGDEVFSTSEANIGALTLSVSSPTAVGRPVAGDYAGSVTLTIALLP
ncbi:hypothetical protein [Brevundimonas lenta]|uniref:Spore coat protein U domain-containing protein n=1 Tax=Brevundimonas lenta TaxID=424796 RepID=A0A7W6NNZ8_9CAUL|nr:hypothetical protein [Brevundimonas lenta]MBB4082323.1 hypothetical protein [Brevundimonas lenta]